MPISLVPSRTDIIILENTHSNLRSHSTVVLLRQNHEMENKNHFYVKKIEIRWLLGKKGRQGLQKVVLKNQSVRQTEEFRDQHTFTLPTGLHMHSHKGKEAVGEKI